jgi:hypothetical protein
MTKQEEEKLKEYLGYDKETGIFKWKRNVHRRTNMIGQEAGGRAGPYVRISFLNKGLLAHRIAWFFVHGTWPEMVDHINGDGYDNRISNLRESNFMLNARNLAIHRNDGKFPFVTKHASRWAGAFQYQGKGIRVGSFDTPQEAAAAVYGYMKGAGLLEHFCIIEKE